MPRVSVIIPTFNCARFLGRALRTALSQTYTDYEVIVADDGSTDDTEEVVARCDGNVRYLYQPNRGLSAARNLALSKASGELIAYLDADDMWYPHKLGTQVVFMDTHQECGIVHSDFTTIDVTDRVINDRFNQEPGRKPPHGFCTMDLLRRCHIQVPTVVERRDCLEKIGQFDERLKSPGEDYIRWILAAMNGFAVGYIDEALAMYRRTPGSISSSVRRMSEGLVMMFEILLHEKSLAAHCGEEGVTIVRGRTYTLQRHLAYLERADGDLDRARQRILGLIREWPLRTGLYLDLLKSVVPFGMAERLRRLRVQARGTAGSQSRWER